VDAIGGQAKRLSRAPSSGKMQPESLQLESAACLISSRYFAELPIAAD